MEGFVNKFSEEEKKRVEEVLAAKGWRLTSYEEYLEFYCKMIYLSKEERVILQNQMADIIKALALVRCNMVPVNFKQKGAK